MCLNKKYSYPRHHFVYNKVGERLLNYPMMFSWIAVSKKDESICLSEMILSLFHDQLTSDIGNTQPKRKP